MDPNFSMDYCYTPLSPAPLPGNSCPTLCDPWTVACQAPIYGIFQARILVWVAMPFWGVGGAVFPTQVLDLLLLHLLHWEADSLPANHLGSQVTVTGAPAISNRRRQWQPTPVAIEQLPTSPPSLCLQHNDSGVCIGCSLQDPAPALRVA